MTIQDIIISAAPGVAAAALALYNWYKMRRGAVLKVGEIVSYGIEWDNGSVIRYYFPILIHNEGSKPGMVTSIRITFKNESIEKWIDINRHIEITQKDDEDESQSIVSIEPLFPVFVPSDEGTVVILECLDYDHDVIPVNEKTTCKVELSYDNKKSSSVEFPFKLLSENISDLDGSVKWFKPFEKEPSETLEITDRELLLSLLKEMNLEDKFELVLNREGTQFDRTIKYNGTKLVRVDLSQLKLSKIPESISKFEMLEYLDISRNLLLELPISIGSLKYLKELDLGYNPPLNYLPVSIGNLSSLKYLGIYGCGLKALPDSIGNLKSMTLINVSKNELTSFPESIGDLDKLEKIYAESNQLVNLPESIGGCQNLKEMKIAQNKLRTIPAGILKIKKFTKLKFDYNEIQELPENLIEEGKHLIELSLDRNHLESLPEGLEKLERLAILRVNYNPLTQVTHSVEESLDILKRRGCNLSYK